MSATSSRLLQLLSLLQGRRDWPGAELADRLEVSGRTIRRDIERLRALGYPVESLTGPAGGYRLRAGSAMPPLLLDDEEAIAIAVGLRTAARASVTGLEQVLPAHLRRRVAALGSATVTAPPPGPTVEPQHLTVIATACRDCERLRFAYESRDGSRTRREVEPHSLLNHGRRWYLIAFDRDRGAWRTFRVDRLSRPASTGVRFQARCLPARDAAAYLEQSITAAPNRFEAVVVLRAAAEAIASRIPAHWGTVEPLGAQACEYRTGDDDITWLALRIAMLGVDFEVRRPPELVEHMQALASRLARATPRAGGRRGGPARRAGPTCAPRRGRGGTR